MVRKIAISAMLVVFAGTALADHRDDRRWDPCKDHPRACAVSAPEIDPTQAVSALMLLAGSVAVLRGRRRRDK